MKKLYLLFILFTATSSFGQITLGITDGPESGSSITIEPEGVTNSYLSFETTNFGVGEPGTDTQSEGYITWTVKNAAEETVSSGVMYTAHPDPTEYEITGLSIGGVFNFEARLVDNSGAALSPDIVFEIEVTVAAYTDVPNLGALRSSAIDDDIYYRVTGEVLNTFSRVGSENQRYFQDATGAILVNDYNEDITTTYAIGDGVKNIKGQLRDENGILVLEPTESNWEAPNSTGNTITPELIDIATLTGNIDTYESRLVRINAVTFTNAGGKFSGFNNYPITDISGTTIFNTYFYEADYVINENNIPEDPNDLVGLIAEYNGTAVIIARSAADFLSLLSVEKNNLEELTVYPNPVTNGSFKIMSTNGSLKNVQLYDSLGKLVITKTVQRDESIDTQTLIPGVYLLKIEEKGKFTTKKLVIE